MTIDDNNSNKISDAKRLYLNRQQVERSRKYNEDPVKSEEIKKKNAESYQKRMADPQKREERNKRRRESYQKSSLDPVKRAKKREINRRYRQKQKMIKQDDIGFVSKISDIASVENGEVSAIGSEISDSNYKEQFAKLIEEPVVIPKEIILNNKNKKTSDYASKLQKNAEMRTHSSADSDGSFLSDIERLQDFDVNEIIIPNVKPVALLQDS